MESPILLPMFVLVAWTLLIWIWMYATRIPAMTKAGVALDPNVPNHQLTTSVPPSVRWKADNYNHLLEQPTLFYAATLGLAVGGLGGSLAVNCAWAYVALRIVHSLVQTTVNKIEVRFAVFVLSNIPLFALAWIGVSEML